MNDHHGHDDRTSVPDATRGQLVTPTFNFHGGKVVYHFTKSGDSVTGTHAPPTF